MAPACQLQDLLSLFILLYSLLSVSSIISSLCNTEQMFYHYNYLWIKFPLPFFPFYRSHSTFQIPISKLELDTLTIFLQESIGGNHTDPKIISHKEILIPSRPLHPSVILILALDPLLNSIFSPAFLNLSLFLKFLSHPLLLLSFRDDLATCFIGKCGTYVRSFLIFLSIL